MIGERNSDIANVVLNIQATGFEQVIAAMKSLWASMREMRESMGKTRESAGKVSFMFQDMVKSTHPVIEQQEQLSAWSKQYKKDLMAGNTSLKTFGGSLTKVAQASRALTMQFLGIMFFGMMLQRTFTGLLKPAMEAFGIMDLWNVMLMTLFIPVMELLFPYFLKFIEFFIELDDSTKMVIGVFTVLMVALGVGLMLFGQLALGLGSLLTFVLELVPALSELGISVSGAFLAVAAIVVAVLVGMWIAWKENFANMRDWVEVWITGLKQQFEGLKKIFSGVMDVLKGLFTGDSDKIVEGLKKIFDGLLDWFAGMFKTLIGMVVSVGIGVLRVIFGVVTAIAGLWLKLIQKLDEWSGGWISKFIGLLLRVVTFMNNMINKAARLASVVPGLGGLSDFELISTANLRDATRVANQPGILQNITIENIFNISDKAEMERMIEDANKKVVEDFSRQAKLPA